MTGTREMLDMTTNVPLGVRNLCEAFQRSAAVDPTAVALRTIGGKVEITWADYAARVRRLAGAFAGLGAGPGATVALMMANRPEFHLCDTAVLHLGAVPFSVYNTLPAADIAHLFGNAGNRIVICEEQFLDRVLAAGRQVDHVVCLDGHRRGVMSWSDLLEQDHPAGFDFEATWTAVGPEDLLTLIYTSGTTGPPKGVEITHANMLAALAATAGMLPVQPGDRVLSYLPAAHIADRWSAHYQSLAFGAQVTSVPDPRLLPAALLDTRPTVFAGVPRVWEKLKTAVETRFAAAADLEQLGLDQVRWSICGAAPVSLEVLEFFAAIGLPIHEVWGLSEVSGIATLNPPGRSKLGTVGRPVPGVELVLADDGELLCRGDQVMRGYRHEPDKTAEAVDRDGWLHTGDIGTVDADGYVRIVDRKKELIINAAGKNISPANIEAKIKAAGPIIGQAVAIGDGRPYNVALIVLDPDACSAFAARRGLPDASPRTLFEHPEIHAMVSEAVGRANEQLSRVEQIKAFGILPDDWKPAGEELTPTMKLKRRVIIAKYAGEIDSLYRTASGRAAAPIASEAR